MGHLRDKRWSNLVFAGLFGISLILLFRILAPFIIPVMLGGFLVVLFQPLHRRLERWCGPYRALSATLSTLAILLLLVGPLCLVAWLVGREVMALAVEAQGIVERMDVREELVSMLPQMLQRSARATADSSHLEQAIVSALFGGASLLKQLLRVSTGLAVDVFLMLVAIYYFFLDGRRLLREGLPLLPLEPRYVHAFTKEFADVAHAIIYGNTLTALVQGALGGIGLLLADVPHAAVWAAAMAVFALVPVGGTAIVWAPIALGLMASGHVTEGIFVLLWGTFVVSSIDNVLRPKLCGSRMTLHPLLVFLSMFGGLAVFGLSGLLIGPLVASLFMAMVRIYQRDFLRLASQARTEGGREQPAGPQRAQQRAPAAARAGVPEHVALGGPA